MLKFPNFLVGSEKTAISDLFRVRFWENIQHGSCRSRFELSNDIKLINKWTLYEKVRARLLKAVSLAEKFTYTVKL